MTEPKLKGHTTMAVLQTNVKKVSSDAMLKAVCMNYWLEKISPEDISKLWAALQATVRGVQPHTISDAWASGTISKRAYRAAVTAPTTGDGFVLSFTVSGT
jgi:hypothetical protein